MNRRQKLSFVQRALAAAALATAGVGASAAIIFSDNFNGENGGVGKTNYTGFSKWTVSDGSVDLIGNGFFDFLPGNGLYVDMDGSTQNAGRMMNSTPIVVTAGTTYVLSYQLAGNRRNTANEVVQVLVNFGSLVNESISLGRNAPFTTFTNTFTATANGLLSLSFEGVGGDNIGMLLDNVVLESRVPTPGTLALAGLALVGVFGLQRQRR